MHDRVHGIIDSGIMEWEVSSIDAWGVGEVHNKSPLSKALLGDGPKGVDDEVWDGRLGERASRVASRTFVNNIIVNYGGTSKSRAEI